MVYKIGFSGTHGVGKTNLVYDTAAKLIKHGFKVDVIKEIAREAEKKGIPINENTTLEAQDWILRRQCLEELDAQMQRYDIVVCDRTLICNYAYIQRKFGECNRQLAFILDYVRRAYPYQGLYHVPYTGELNPNGRAADPTFQKDIAERVDNLLKTNSIEHILLSTELANNRDKWVEQIVNNTLTHLKK